MVLTPDRYRLECDKRAAKVTGFTADENGKPLTPVLTRDEDRWSRVPRTPATFHPKYGTYVEISKEAERLNKIQMTSGFLDHLFSVVPAESVGSEAVSDAQWLDTLAKIQ